MFDLIYAIYPALIMLAVSIVGFIIQTRFRSKDKTNVMREALADPRISYPSSKK